EKYKGKERILKAARDKQALTYKGRPIRLVSDLCTETCQARKEWQEIFNVMNRKNMQPRILYPASLTFRIEGEIKVFPKKQKLKEFIPTQPALQEILRGTL
ncbi:LORF1 protein, partial [Crocuta crocuta]